MFFLLYRQHGGSGLSLSLADVMDLDWPRMLWMCERLEEQRKAEVEAIKK